VAGTNELISQRDPALVSTVGNRLTRKSPYSISGDGRWFVFESFANDLLPNDTNGSCDVFLQDLWTGQTALVSAAADGTPALGGHSYGGVISANGRYVAFASVATNLTANPGVTNLNIFRKDLQTGAIILVSVASNGTDAAAGNCSDAVISADGRYVAFVSTAKNLAPGTFSGAGGFGNFNTFWRDVNSSTTIVMNNPGSPTLPVSPSMSADGRYVAYQTNQLNQLRIRDTQLGRDIYTNLATVTSAAISPDGSRVLYGQTSPNQVRVDQIATGSNLLSFSSAASIQGSGQWSSDGHSVVFVGSTNATNAVFVCDLPTNITLVSFSAVNGRVANAASDLPVISGDGRYVAYRSFATNIVAGDTNPTPKLYLFDRFSGQNTILSAAQTGASPLPWISPPVISGGADNMAFLTAGCDLVANDLNRVPDAFAVRVLYHIQMTPVTTPGGTTTLTWQAVPLRTYGVQFKNNLSDPQWQDLPVSISFIGNEGMATVPADQPNRFYRVVETQ
jgi:Tol biopolymer transport system component